MPIYDYQCPSCTHRFELRQSFDADPLATCPRCQAVCSRQFHPVPVIYKGSGFYTTDYARGSSSNGKPSTGATGSKPREPVGAAAG